MGTYSSPSEGVDEGGIGVEVWDAADRVDVDARMHVSGGG